MAQFTATATTIHERATEPESHTFEAENASDARHWVINHCDCSREWTVTENLPKWDYTRVGRNRLSYRAETSKARFVIYDRRHCVEEPGWDIHVWIKADNNHVDLSKTYIGTRKSVKGAKSLAMATMGKNWYYRSFPRR
jgi:hypothetical protein